MLAIGIGLLGISFALAAASGARPESVAATGDATPYLDAVPTSAGWTVPDGVCGRVGREAVLPKWFWILLTVVTLVTMVMMLGFAAAVMTEKWSTVSRASQPVACERVVAGACAS